MPNIHCGKQTKMSKTIGVTIRHTGRNNYFMVPFRTPIRNKFDPLRAKKTFVR